jgi:hypothetical protein
LRLKYWPYLATKLLDSKFMRCMLLLYAWIIL